MSASYYVSWSPPQPKKAKRRHLDWLSSCCCGIFEEYDPVIYHPETHSASPAVSEDREAEEERQVSGIWKRNILMGGKCKLPDYSGVIIYDASGNLIPSKPARLALTWK